MAKPKEVSVTVGLTINLGNYESMRIDMGETVRMSQDDDPEYIRERLANELTDHVWERANAAKKEN